MRPPCAHTCSNSETSSLRLSAGSVSSSQNDEKSPSSSLARSMPGSAGAPEALQLLLDRLAAHDVLRFGEVAEHVEVLQALELAEQLGAPRARWVAPRTLCFDGLHH